MKTNEKGISLIVLVITIVVMIILASAIILSISSGDIRGKANEAVYSSDISTAKEIMAVARSEWELNYDELKGEYDNSFKEYAEEKLKGAGIDYVSVSNKGALNTIYTDKAGKTAIIPEGFSVSEVVSEQTVDTGLVIVDEAGNEFVWVPVDNMNMFKRTKTYTETITDPGTNYTEPYKALGDPIGEVVEYNEMYDSVQENGGFYIARYESGKEGTDTVVSKKGSTVWKAIPWGTSMTEVGTIGAVYRARQMYKGAKSVVSTLCYGVQWDAALQFIATKDANYLTDSTGKGYYTHDKNGNLIEGMEEKVQPAGYYAVNNIYDMAGNVQEWTMEAYYTDHRVLRGGNYGNDGTSRPASVRVDYNYPEGYYSSSGFRVTLYIK